MNYPRYKEFADLRAVCDFGEETFSSFVVVDREESDAALLQAVFSIDPITKLPYGDLVQYMSKDTNPQIKQFIQNQLMSDQLPVGSNSGQQQRLSDDDLLRYMRKQNESTSDYVSRMASYIKDDYIASKQAKK